MGNMKHRYDEGAPVFPSAAAPHTVSHGSVGSAHPTGGRNPTILETIGEMLFASNQRLVSQLARLSGANDRAFGPDKPQSDTSGTDPGAPCGSLQYVNQQIEWRQVLHNALDEELARIERLA